ncbi:hypothetical protein LIER_03572 [Lithospermum erythrorhizon]|uniref:Uncharacterized protein n=1 Tax=Lithospermum erythrorhizon TaxID=34254 RepID=A0AAV3NV60_LITER
MSASFTSNGSYLISASNDCNVYIWNCNRPEEPSVFESKSIKSFECFSSDSSIAIPWCDMDTNNSRKSFLHQISDLWGLVIVTASIDGRIQSFHNYGLPVPV